MNRSRKTVIFLLILILSGMFQFKHTGIAIAGDIPPGPDRFINTDEEYTQYSWWLIQWEDNKVICEIITDHTGYPSLYDISDACGDDIYKRWISSDACQESTGDPGECEGLYLHLASQIPLKRIIPIKLPEVVVWLTLQGCSPYASTHRCDRTPMLVLSGEEPLSGYAITHLEGNIDGEPFSCDPTCLIDLVPTDEDGVEIKFWAYSNYGDSSKVFTAKVRVQNGLHDEDPYHYVDIISDQWRGSPQAPCMDVWNVFPPFGGLQNWLDTPDSFSELETALPYDYLAGALIRQGNVDTSSCLDGGLLGNGYASPCGSETARDQVLEWQNQFDEQIYNSAVDVGVPAQLLKNIFSRESQFWPGKATKHSETGLGQMTNNGADTTLLWNTPFFEQFCSGIFGDMICSKGYSYLTEQEKNILQESMVQSVDASCEECPLGIDVEKAKQSIYIFANAVLANCAQTNKVIELNYQVKGYIPAYEDLWKFTLVNYNAGPGCLGLAINKTSSQGEPLSWDYVSRHFTEACKHTVDYVDDISKLTP